MRARRSVILGISLAMSLVARPAVAEPGGSSTLSGTIAAQIIEPGAIERLDDLRFAAFASPAAAATMTITADGVISATGQVATTMNAFPSPAGRGPARFRINGTPNRFFIPFHPRSVTISNGTSTMLVDQMADNVTGRGRLDANGHFEYRIGGTLHVGANQQPGRYRGDFQISVLFQ
jgi:Domain of unknown function (DUF4402)